ncbi:MAG: YiiX/YebB-like N1pC/P60 family cysteine hydrolase [Verrucomicrobia bacterium]|nr:YiiX/YebB-like N1pC/P60 family cysteine hydrolase [Verrucomicrobiota bacterium]
MAHESQLLVDCETLRRVIPGLERLEGQWNDARVSIAARTRGYFTPDEDDQVRQMLLAYRNYRIALYEIIFRCWDYRLIEPAALRLRVFLVAFAAALALYSKSLKAIQAYEHEPLVRKKLNEADAKFELEEGFFEELLRAYSSLGNYRGIIRGAWFWRGNRREIQKLAAADTDWHWLVGVIVKELPVVRQRLIDVLRCRLRYDWRAFLRTTLQPVRRTRYSVRSLIGNAGANLRTTGHYVPALNTSVVTRLRPLLQPGDVLLIRAEKKLTAAILPGFWAHAALFVGSQRDLDVLGVAGHAFAQKHWAELASQDGGLGCIIEAISPRVQIQPLGKALYADHVVVLRPVLPTEQVAAALTEAFGHVGKAYDFEFDFNISTRLVCTELIYRCYHHRGSIDFPLIKRLGRYTLTGDDVANLVLKSLPVTPPAQPSFSLAAMALKIGDGEAQLIEKAELLEAMRRIQSGWRPAKSAGGAHA